MFLIGCLLGGWLDSFWRLGWFVLEVALKRLLKLAAPSAETVVGFAARGRLKWSCGRRVHREDDSGAL